MSFKENLLLKKSQMAIFVNNIVINRQNTTMTFWFRKSNNEYVKLVLFLDKISKGIRFDFLISIILYIIIYKSKIC